MTCKRDLEEATAVLSAWGMTGVVDAEVLHQLCYGEDDLYTDDSPGQIQ